MNDAVAVMAGDGRGLVRDAWKRSAVGLGMVFAFGAFINVLKFAMPMYTLQILDRVPSSRSVETLVMLTAIALPAVLCGVALEAVRRRMLTHWGAWLERLFGPHLCLSGISGAGVAPGLTATQSLDELSTLRHFVERGAVAFLDVLWAPVFLVAVCLIHPVLGAILAAVIAILLALGVAQERMTRAPRRASGDASNDAQRIIAAAERNADIVGALSMAPRLTELWRRSVVTRLDERDRTEARQALFEGLIKALYRTLYIGGMGVGIWLVIDNSLTLGGVIAGNIMMRFGFRLVEKAVRKWRSLMKAGRAYRRLKAQLATVSEPDGSMAARDLSADLVLDAVTFRYPGRSDSVLRRIALSAKPGELVCIVGPSASGKSTFSRLITGVLSPRSGQVRLGNIDVARLPPDTLERVVGYLPQEARLFRGSVRDNIARMGSGNFEDVLDAAALAGIHETIVGLAQGYDTIIDDEAPTLSGGERKRIALARAFYGRPRLVVLDEPEANLDRRARRGLMRALKELTEHGSTVVVTTQSTRLAEAADKALILGGGRAEVQQGGAVESAANVNAMPSRGDARRARREPAGIER